MQINKEQKKYNCWFSVWEVRGDSMNLQWHKVFSELTCVLYVPLQAFYGFKGPSHFKMALRLRYC